MSVVFWVGSDVLEDERAGGGNDQDLQHEVVQRLKKDRTEGLGLDRVAVVISEELSSCWEGVSRETLGQIHFKLVTDAFDTYAQQKSVTALSNHLKLASSNTYRLVPRRP